MVTYAALASAGMLRDVVNDIKANDVRTNIRTQEDTKPEIDDVICQYLDGSTLKNALNFIKHVRASKMKIKWSAANVWSVRFKRKHVMDIVITHGFWHIRLVYDHIAEKSLFSKRDKEVLNSFIGSMRGSIAENLNTATALS